MSGCAPEIAERIGVRPETLDTPVKESAFLSLASFVDPWRLVFFELLAPTDISDVDAENVGRSEQEKRVASLRKWKSKYGAEATYRVIIQSVVKCGHVDKAEAICRQLLQDQNQASLQERLALPNSEQAAQSTPSLSVVRTIGEPSCGLEVQIDQLDQQYIEIETLVLETIKARNVPLDKVLNWIRFPPTSLRTQFADFLRSQAKILFSSTNVDELFAIVSSYWNLFHPALLQHLVNKLGDQEIKSQMDRYMADLHHFRIQTTLGDFLDKWVGEIPPGYQEFVLELGEEWRERTVEDFEQFRIRLSRLQSFGGGHTSFMKTAKSSSILVVLALPEQAFPINFRQTVVHKFLRDENVVRVIVDRQCVFNLENLMELERRLLELRNHNIGDIQELRYILTQPGVDPNVYNQNGWTPLCHISYYGHTEVAELLLNYGAKVDLPTEDEFAYSPLMMASSEGYVDTCAVLIERGAIVDYQNKDGTTALYMASHHGHKAVVELLLDRRASVDKPNMKHGSTALMVASQNGQTKVVSVLISRGAAVDYQNKEGTTALYVASQNGHKAVVELLLDRGASVDKPDTEAITPLIVGGQKGHKDVCQMLIQHGAEVNHQDKDGWSPLHYASAHGHPSIVELLIKSGAQLDIQTKDGTRALALAAYQGHKQVVHILLNAGANPDIQGQESMTALMYATQRGHKDIVKALVERKANLNITAVMTSGWTALHLASKEGLVEISRMLIEEGADMDIKDKNGLTAHDIASTNSHPAVCQLLEQYGYKHPPTARSDPVTSLQTFRDILCHGSKLSDTPTKHQPTQNVPGEYYGDTL